MTPEFDKWIKKLNKLAEPVREEVKEILEFHVSQISLEAIRAAPGAGSLIDTKGGPTSVRDLKNGDTFTPIAQAIGYKIENEGYSGTVYVDKSAGPVAAWVEFGTGQSAKSYLATVAPEWKSLAQTFYINGKGTIIAQPYLYPAYLKHRILMIKEIKEAIKKKI